MKSGIQNLSKRRYTVAASNKRGNALTQRIQIEAVLAGVLEHRCAHEARERRKGRVGGAEQRHRQVVGVVRQLPPPRPAGAVVERALSTGREPREEIAAAEEDDDQSFVETINYILNFGITRIRMYV